MYPREHAKKILLIPALKERRAYLADQVPENWRALVKQHLLNYAALKKAGKNQGG